MTFYKMRGQEMVFQLLNEEVKEEFVIWLVGSKMPFREINGISAKDIYFMKAEAFKQQYPTGRKDHQFVRHIGVYENNQISSYDFGFKKTANDQINIFINNMKSVRQDPLAVKIVLRVIGQGISKEYIVIAMGTVGRVEEQQLQQATQQANQQYNVAPIATMPSKPQQVPLQPSSALSGANMPFSLQVPKKALEINRIEAEMVASFNSYAENCSEDRYVEVWQWNEPKISNLGRTPELRIREIYKQTYKKCSK